MELLLAGISLSVAVVAVLFSAVSLVLHYVRRAEPPEVTELHTKLHAIQSDHTDLLDKVTHWMRRDAVRRARAGAEAKADEGVALPGVDTKAALRRRVMASGLGVAGASE